MQQTRTNSLQMKHALGREMLHDLTPRSTHRGVLTLDAGAVEAQSCDTGGAARDMKDALIVALAGLWLRQILGCQGDGLHHSHWDVDLGGGQDLWAVLQGEQGQQ